MKTVRIETPNGAVAAHDSAGRGPALVLIHGNSSSSRAFSRQFNGPLGGRFRLVAVDLPGHGESDDAKDPGAYSLPGHAYAVRAAVDALGLDEAWFAGWSLGGHVTLEMAPDLPRARGFVIFGTPPITSGEARQEAFLPHPAMKFTFQEGLDRIEASAYVAAFFRPGLQRYSAVLPRRCFAHGRAGAQQPRGERPRRTLSRRGCGRARSQRPARRAARRGESSWSTDAISAPSPCRRYGGARFRHSWRGPRAAMGDTRGVRRADRGVHQ